MSDHDREPSPRSGAPRIPMDDELDPRDPSPVPDIAIGASTTSTTAAADAPPPHFEPLFTLLTNSTNNTTIHPRVHYLFSDDDPSILPGSAPPDPSHRALVLDLAPAPTVGPEGNASGWCVSWASSLSPSFAVTDSSISVVQQGHRDDGSVMLKIDGVEREPVPHIRGTEGGSGTGTPSNVAASSGTVGKEDVDTLVDDFRRRMGVLRKVVGQGHKRREALDQQQQDEFEDDEDGEQQEQGLDDIPGERDDDEPISPTAQTHSQHDDSRWK